MIPEQTKLSIDRYVNDGIPPGGFVTAVLANDLMQAFARADSFNASAMIYIVRYVYNHTPIGCHGSYEAVSEWINNYRKAREVINEQMDNDDYL